MTTYTHDTVPTEFVEANGIRFAYRRFGAASGVPVVFLQHFMGNRDDHDPALTDAFAVDREVILFDNAGVASSTGTPPTRSSRPRDTETGTGETPPETRALFFKTYAPAGDVAADPVRLLRSQPGGGPCIPGAHHGRRWRQAVVVAVARLGELVCESAAKALVGRARPDLVPTLTTATGASYPSGHTAGSVATYGAVALVAATVLARPAARWMLALAFAVFDPGRPLDPGAAAPAGEPLGEDGSAP